METPFIFGKIATEKNFTDREMETANLVQNFTSLINTIIISPRRWGKSSLVNKAAKLAMEQDNKLRICHIDLFNVRNEEHFYSLLAQKVIAATSTKWEEAVESAKSFFSHLVPKISIGSDPTNEISIDFDWETVKQNPDEVLDLAEKIAQKKGLKIVICVDEFQNIAEFTDPDYFQKKLRSHWQQHQSVAYCLYGSKRHMMMEVFTNSSKPFYKFGNLMFLNKIDTPYLVDFFNIRCADTGKSINDDAANLIVKLVDNQVYTFPLAGTRPRGKTDEEDRLLEGDLLADEKELAEHNMLVDLGRNDIGKISEIGSVKVNRYMDIVRFSHVMHIGSTVEGILRENYDYLSTIDSILPAGTLSGAPKIRACEIINELEDNKRGIYGGAIGYIDLTGNLDTCIAIRIAFARDKKVFIRVGAGIVADSVPENEFVECNNKARAVMDALRMANGGIE